MRMVIIIMIMIPKQQNNANVIIMTIEIFINKITAKSMIITISNIHKNN